MDKLTPRRRAGGRLTKYLKELSPSKLLALGFLTIILLGGLLLSAPFVSRNGQSVGFLNGLFTATSATCVTGLAVVDTVTQFNLFGQLVILFLIQLGGLGFMLFTTTVLVVLGMRISLRNRMLLHETMSMPGLSGSVRTTLRFMWIVFSIEFVGAALLAVRFIPEFGVAKGAYYGAFHAISAFCNAGFDLMGDKLSLVTHQEDPYVLLVISTLIILGGLGFAVLSDMLLARKSQHGLMLHSRIVLITTATLLLLGTVFFVGSDWNNPLTLAKDNAGWAERLLNAFFQSVTTRTAGFYSFDQKGLSEAGKYLSVVLMFVGASPASTGGGVKTSTMFVLAAVTLSVFKGRTDINVFKKRLPLMLVRTALVIIMLASVALVSGAVLISMAEHHRDWVFLDLLFEAGSALGTVGLSSVGTPNLRPSSHVVLILLMFIGRVGPMTMMLSFAHRQTKPDNTHFPEESIIIG